ncbi:MAG: hypothetical protein U9R72_08345 [Chloroflexota bacterium]|nr:hypothetical protein [Chloroflexota bacterium]
MDRQELKDRLTWVLLATNVIAGVALVVTAFGLVTGERQINLLYLGLGVVCLVASGAWLLNLGSA